MFNHEAFFVCLGLEGDDTATYSGYVLILWCDGGCESWAVIANYKLNFLM